MGLAGKTMELNFMEFGHHVFLMCNPSNCEKNWQNLQWKMAHVDDLPLKHDDFPYAKLPEGRKSFATCD